MKRLFVGIALAFALPNCIQQNPVAEEQKSGEQQLRESIGPFCDDICQRGNACGIEVGDDCPAGCRDHMDAFVDHGDQCVTLGQSVEDCLTSLRTCDELTKTDDCDPHNAAHDGCERADSTPPSAGDDVPPSADAPPVYCDGSGGGSIGVAPSANGQPSQTVSCSIEYLGCSDGSDYQVSCHAYDGALVCNCFRDGIVNGVAFTPGEDFCLGDYQVNGPCGWNIQP